MSAETINIRVLPCRKKLNLYQESLTEVHLITFCKPVLNARIALIKADKPLLQSSSSGTRDDIKMWIPIILNQGVTQPDWEDPGSVMVCFWVYLSRMERSLRLLKAALNRGAVSGFTSLITDSDI